MGENLMNRDELEFVVFCLESVAARLGRPAEEVYRSWTDESDILRRYVIPSYGILHTQGKAYIVDDILDVMKERGVSV